MKEFLKRLFEPKATVSEAAAIQSKLLGMMNTIVEVYDESLKKSKNDIIALTKRVALLENRLNNSFDLIVGKDELREEFKALESELYGRDASESTELHKKLVRFSVVRSLLNRPEVPKKTYYKIIRQYVECPESADELVRIKVQPPTDAEIMRELHGL